MESLVSAINHSRISGRRSSDSLPGQSDSHSDDFFGVKDLTDSFWQDRRVLVTGCSGFPWILANGRVDFRGS